MPHADLFSPDYFAARERFRAAARAAGCDLEAHGISARGPGGQELTIDAAVLAAADAAMALVVSSGLHGVEGPLGSAVQLALLERLAGGGDGGWSAARRGDLRSGVSAGSETRAEHKGSKTRAEHEGSKTRAEHEGSETLAEHEGSETLAEHEGFETRGEQCLRLVLLHSLNPYGFAWRRRTNEDNVDLNRNWLRPGEPYRGSPPLYARLDALFNPPSRPGWMGLFKLRAALAAVRFGVRAIGCTLPAGQYDHPRGLFFGGRGPTETHQIVARQLARWVGASPEVLHVDFHTGLGRWGTYKLLADAPGDSPLAAWLRERFGGESVSAAGSPSGPVVYFARGAWGGWCEHALPGRTYRFATAEFGTHGPLRVLAALATENRAHFHCAPGDPRLEQARQRLAEVFAPKSPKWREQAVEQGLAIVDRAMGRG